MSEDVDIQNLLRGYAAAVPDNGFTEAVLFGLCSLGGS